MDNWLVAFNAFFKRKKKPKSVNFEIILVSKGECGCFCVKEHLVGVRTVAMVVALS